AALNSSVSGVCNVGSGTARCFNDVVTILGNNLGMSFDIEYIDNPFDFYQMHTEADMSEAQRILQWQPSHTLEQGMHDYIQRLKRGQRGPLEANNA
ncbi:MAG: ADP-glyceromanno-heptose 6-epimerase, partial [Mariprofundaceae bacterium]|nr:ADP-glyceromanno-heptose 6-epimerase [Mariprofundaceae bacterium]